MPIQKHARHAYCSGSSAKNAQYRIAAAAQPNDQLLCTVPTAFAQCCGERIVSAIMIVTTDHSPPKPMPCSVRVMSSCQNECVKPDRQVKMAKVAIVHWSTRTRP